MAKSKLVTKTFPMFIASIGLLFIGTGYGDLALAPIVNPIWHEWLSLSHQPVTNAVDPTAASGLINLGIFVIIIAALCYIAPMVIAYYGNRNDGW